MFELNKRIALITGASGAIGGSIAEVLAINGAKVVITGRNQEQLEILASEIANKTSKDQVFVITKDLSSFDAGVDLIEEVSSKFGEPDTVVCNAGLTKDKLMISMQGDDLDQVMQTNFYASFGIMKAAVRKMCRSRFGRLIAISSVVGYTGNVGQTNYSSSKSALTGLVRSLAQEVAARSVTVNAIAPGFIVSKMTDVIPERHQEMILSTIPSKKMGQPADIASAALFLASNETGYITGQTLHVNGGMYMS